MSEVKIKAKVEIEVEVDCDVPEIKAMEISTALSTIRTRVETKVREMITPPSGQPGIRVICRPIIDIKEINVSEEQFLSIGS